MVLCFSSALSCVKLVMWIDRLELFFEGVGTGQWQMMSLLWPSLTSCLPSHLIWTFEPVAQNLVSLIWVLIWVSCWQCAAANRSSLDEYWYWWGMLSLNEWKSDIMTLFNDWRSVYLSCFIGELYNGLISSSSHPWITARLVCSNSCHSSVCLSLSTECHRMTGTWCCTGGQPQ